MGINIDIVYISLSGFYKLRVGDYRIIYEFERENKLIIIIKIAHRSEIY
jgi:mRNA interferase RelE/StbE